MSHSQHKHALISNSNIPTIPRTQTDRETARSEFPIKTVCLFVFVHITVPQNVFFIKLVSEEAGQTSLVKAGQGVFRWTEPGGGGRGR